MGYSSLVAKAKEVAGLYDKTLGYPTAKSCKTLWKFQRQKDGYPTPNGGAFEKEIQQATEFEKEPFGLDVNKLAQDAKDANAADKLGGAVTGVAGAGAGEAAKDGANKVLDMFGNKKDKKPEDGKEGESNKNDLEIPKEDCFDDDNVNMCKKAHEELQEKRKQADEQLKEDLKKAELEADEIIAKANEQGGNLVQQAQETAADMQKSAKEMLAGVDMADLEGGTVDLQLADV